MKKFLTHFALSTIIGLLLGTTVVLVFPKWVGLPESSFSNMINKAGLYLSGGQVSYSYAVKKAVPAVVNIATSTISHQRRAPSPRNPFTENSTGNPKVETSLGSGVIISPEGFLLTNNHVIEGADRVIVALRDGRETVAKLVGRDPETDLAVLKIDLKGLPSLQLADSSQGEVGDVVLAIGNPFGLGQTVTQGIISATGRNDISLNTYEDFIQTDAAINVGNSGGALVNAYGDLIGINTLLFSRSGGNEGVGFAIPSSMARFVTTSIIKYGRVIRGWLGIESQPLNSQLAEAYSVKNDAGILISGVFDGGPADKAGLRRGDILTAINGMKTNDGNKVMNIVTQEAPGSEVTMTVLRDNKSIEVKATVATRPNMVSS